MRRKLISVIMVFALLYSLAIPKGQVEAKAVPSDEWDTARYGDILDMGPMIRAQAKDPVYRAKQDEDIKKAAERFNSKKDAGPGETVGDTFTFNGAKKIFMGYDSIYGNYLKTYTLRSIGENVEVWVSNDLAYYTPVFDENGEWVDEELDPSRPAHVITQEQVDLMRDKFDEEVYPTDTSFFGTPDSHTGLNAYFTLRFSGNYGNLVNYQPSSYIPEGYEVKERVMILVDNIRDENYYDSTYPFIIGGFYSPTYEDYFDRNIINIDSSNWETRLEKDWLPTTAHEFQHLIHDDNDPDEETWINEGMSDFAEYLCFDEHPWGHVNYYLDHPENSLVNWDEYYTAETGPETLADYGQAYLLQLYLNDQYGKELIKALATDGENGIESVNKILEQFATGIDFKELFRRFTIATAIDSSNIDSPNIEDGIYKFDSIDLNVSYKEAAKNAKDGVPAWGADYMVLDGASRIDNIIFDGVQFMPTPWKVVADPLGSGNNVLWGNNGNLKDNLVMFEADLTNANNPTLKFDNYIDIEPGWDAGMVQVSTDKGETWASLANANTVDKDTLNNDGELVFPLNDQAPQIYYNLPGFTGRYEGWVQETFDLSAYKGQKVLIGFRYMTDAAYNDSGWFIDNITIQEIGYLDDCSDISRFLSLDKLRDIEVDYAVTFINESSLGSKGNRVSYKVLNINPFNITEIDAIKLREFFNGGDNYMIVWYAAPIGKTDPVEYSYSITNIGQSTRKVSPVNKSGK